MVGVASFYNADASTTALDNDRPKGQTFAGKLLARGTRKFLEMKSRINTPTYTLSAVESTIYDERHCASKEQLLMESDLVNVEGVDGRAPASVSRYLLRCFEDRRTSTLDILMLVNVAATTVVAPLTFIWGGHWDNFDQIPGGYTCLQVDIILDASFAIYLLMKLNMSFIHPQRRVEIITRRKILKRVLTNPMYWVELCSTLTYVAIVQQGVHTIVNALKIVRLLHLVYLPDSMWRFRNKAIVRLMKPVMMLIFLSHWVACVLSCIGGYRLQIEEEGSDAFVTTWTGTTGAEHHVSGHVSAYVMTFVEACLLLTGSFDNPLGQGSARENNFGALVLVAIMAPIGCVGVSMIIAAVVREQTLLFALEMRHQESKSFMTRALENLNIPRELRRRVYSLHYFQKMSHDNEALLTLFDGNNLSPSLDSALKVYLYRDSVLYSEYFKDKNTNYILEVIRKLVDYVYLPGDYVTRRGEVGTTMFFVVRGILTVFVPNGRLSSGSNCAIENALNVGKKWKGDYFGEIALIQDSLRTAWVRADCYVILSALSRSSMEDVWRYYPEQRQELVERVIAMREKDQKRQMKAATTTHNSTRSLAFTRVSTHTIDDDDYVLASLKSQLAASSADLGGLSVADRAGGPYVPQTDNLRLSNLYQRLRVDQSDVQARLQALEEYVCTTASSNKGQSSAASSRRVSGRDSFACDGRLREGLLPAKPRALQIGHWRRRARSASASQRSSSLRQSLKE